MKRRYLRVGLYEPVPIARAGLDAPHASAKATRPESAKTQGAQTTTPTAAARPGAACQNMASGRRAR